MTRLEDLTPDPHNARKHDERNLGMIQHSLEHHGGGRSILIDENDQIIAGHGVTEAAKRAGFTDVQVIDAKPGTITAVRLVGLSDEAKRELAIADNRTTETSEWDLEELQLALDDGADLSWGFTDDELAALLGPDEEEGPDPAPPGPDEAPEVPAEPITQPGDLWTLGDHRLLCGDATSADDLARLLDGHNPAMVWTDPPYGMDLETDYTGRARGATGEGIRGRAFEAVEGDDRPFDPRPLLRAFRKTSEIFLFGADYYASQLPRNGGMFVWDKCVTAEGRVSEGAERMIGSSFELVWSKQRHQRQIVRVFHRGFASADRSRPREHPTQKPIQLAEWFIERFSKSGEMIADVYAGSGTAILAGERLQRPVRAMEIDPGYCDVIVARWEALSGLPAIRG
jgi:DNA modification methylase